MANSPGKPEVVDLDARVAGDNGDHDAAAGNAHGRSGSVSVNADLSSSIDALGASVVRVKRSQTIEDQAAVEELEARYTVLRRAFDVYDAKLREHQADAANTGHNGRRNLQETASVALETARQKVVESYANMKDFFADEETKARLKARSDSVREDLGSAWRSVAESVEARWRELRHSGAERNDTPSPTDVPRSTDGTRKDET